MSRTLPPPVTLAVGPEAVLVERVVADTVTGARKADPDSERRVIDASAATAAGAIQEACSPTLFGSGAVVVVEHAELADAATVQAILASAGDPQPGMYLVVEHAGGARGKAVAEQLRRLGATEVPCPEIKKGKATTEFLNSELRRHGGRKATPEALNLLITAVGHDVRALAAACAQLAADVESDPIGAEAVHEYFGGVAEVAGYQIADSVMMRRTAQAVRLLRISEFLDGARVGPATVASLAAAVRQSARVQAAPPGLPERGLAALVSVPPWKIRLLRDQARRWRPENLARALLLLADADAAVKGGLREGEQLDPAQKGLALQNAITSMTAGPGS